MMKKLILFLCITLILLSIPNTIYAYGVEEGKPDIWPTYGKVTSLFGEQRATHIHMGLDISNNTGTFIYATMDGEVIYADWDSGFGKKIEIEHKNRYSTVYGHLDIIYIEVGDIVEKGDIIATMGNTGHSTGSHLHYEVLKDDINQDPLEYLL